MLNSPASDTFSRYCGTKRTDKLFFICKHSRETYHLISIVLNILFVRALADRVHTKPLIVNTVNPGFCISGFRNDLSGFSGIINWLMEIFLARPTEAGSRQLVWATLAGDKGHEEELRGAYISATNISEASDWVLSDEGKAFQEKVWVRAELLPYTSAPLNADAVSYRSTSSTN